MSERARYCYSIAGLRFLCDLAWPVEILQEAAPFLTPLEEDQDPAAFDLVIRLDRTQALPPVPEGATFQSGRLYTRDGGLFMLLKWEDPPYACSLQRLEQGRVDCLCLPDHTKYLRYSRQLSDLIGMEAVLLHFQALILHASFVRWNGRGILFSAPSGTGKSTQADLWERFEGSETINGDRAGLRRTEDGWVAYGLPYAGSSGIYRNESAPVTAIVVLAQAQENVLRPLSPAQAVRYLYPETTIHRWDRSFSEDALALLIRLVSEVPVYRLECRPDRGAVEAVKRVILKEEDPNV